MPVKDIFKEGDLLYHSAHGLCFVKEITKQGKSTKDSLYYSIVPKTSSPMKVRFLVAVSDIEISGFHALISFKEANQILDYLKAGQISGEDEESRAPVITDFIEDCGTWTFAKALLFFAQDKSEVREQRKRQILERAVRGLIRELAYALESSVKDTVSKVQKSLERNVKVNPAVLNMLTQVSED